MNGLWEVAKFVAGVLLLAIDLFFFVVGVVVIFRAIILGKEKA